MSGDDFITGLFPSLDDALLAEMEMEYSEEVTQMVLRNMGSSKAPRPDGYQVIFFKNTWKLIGQLFMHSPKAFL